jgi:hypothetical protein
MGQNTVESNDFGYVPMKSSKVLAGGIGDRKSLIYETNSIYERLKKEREE